MYLPSLAHPGPVVHHQSRYVLVTHPQLQGHQLYMARFFWYLVESDFTSVRY